MIFERKGGCVSENNLLMANLQQMRPATTPRKWNGKLTSGPRNPFPLAPADQVRQGLVTPETYALQNEEWSNFVGNIMLNQLPRVKGGRFEILGFGLGRCVKKWLPTAVQSYGCTAAIRDSSKVACGNALQFIGQNDLARGVKVTKTDIEKAWEKGEIPEDITTAYYVSQVAEHQGTYLASMMYRLGRFLQMPGRRAVYLILPRLEDNDPAKVCWNSAVPPRDSEWQDPLQQGLQGQQVNIYVYPKHKYFNRTYTFYCLEPGR